jgi:hypothetical protein
MAVLRACLQSSWRSATIKSVFAGQSETSSGAASSSVLMKFAAMKMREEPQLAVRSGSWGSSASLWVVWKFPSYVAGSDTRI